MKLVNAEFEIMEQQEVAGEYINCVYKHIEKCGRTCYKSEDKMTDDSAWPFVGRMIASQHNAMLEHGTIYLYFESNPENCFKHVDYPICKFTAHYNWNDVVGNAGARYRANKFSRVNSVYRNNVHSVYITTNLRVIIENGWLDDLQYISEFKPEGHERRVTVNFTVDRFTGEEFLRHRVFSFARESTRYCNYSKDKFGNGIQFTYVPWASTDNATEPEHNSEEWGTILPYNTNNWTAEDWWLWALQATETAYLKLIEKGWQPQQARVVLPCAIKSPLIMTGFVSDWLHFFDLRALGTTGAPHPQAKELAEPLMVEFQNRGYIEEYLTMKENTK